MLCYVRFIRRCAVPFLRSDCLNPMLRVAIAGLSLDHREAHESISLFLEYFIRAARDNNVSHQFFCPGVRTNAPRGGSKGGGQERGPRSPSKFSGPSL